jgi:dihydrofolate reductase
VLIYSVIASLDGYTAGTDGKFDWAAPDEEVHAFVNEVERPVGTYLYGRKMYETMRFWQDPDPAVVGQSPASQDYARIWQAADKIVYSTSLTEALTPRTRIERAFDPEVVRELKHRGDVSVGGPGLAAHAIRARLVDEYQLFVIPVIVGGGTAALPTGFQATLRLADERRFASGVVYLRYQAQI